MGILSGLSATLASAGLRVSGTENTPNTRAFDQTLGVTKKNADEQPVEGYEMSANQSGDNSSESVSDTNTTLVADADEWDRAEDETISVAASDITAPVEDDESIDSVAQLQLLPVRLEHPTSVDVALDVATAVSNDLKQVIDQQQDIMSLLEFIGDPQLSKEIFLEIQKRGLLDKIQELRSRIAEIYKRLENSALSATERLALLRELVLLQIELLFYERQLAEVYEYRTEFDDSWVVGQISTEFGDASLAEKTPANFHDQFLQETLFGRPAKVADEVKNGAQP